MNEQTKELIAIGASISAHCQPCLTFHLNKARELGIKEEEVNGAIEIGFMVEKGSLSAMRTFTQNSAKQYQNQSQNVAKCNDSKCCG